MKKIIERDIEKELCKWSFCDVCLDVRKKYKLKIPQLKSSVKLLKIK